MWYHVRLQVVPGQQEPCFHLDPGVLSPVGKARRGGRSDGKSTAGLALGRRGAEWRCASGAATGAEGRGWPALPHSLPQSCTAQAESLGMLTSLVTNGSDSLGRGRLVPRRQYTAPRHPAAWLQGIPSP